MMLAIAASNGENMPWGWFQRGYWLTPDAYKESLEMKALPWARKITKKSDYVFHHHGASKNWLDAVKNLLDANRSFWPKDYWPSQSPYLNFFNFSLWTNIEEKVCKICHSNTDKFKTSVSSAWRLMRKRFVRKVCKSFRSRLDRVIAAKGGHIE